MASSQNDIASPPSEGSPSKVQSNGVDTTSPLGFRHHLPQIATMTRNPKIAQSKASARAELASTEQATLHVEGVGKVFHIGSDVTEMDQLPPVQASITNGKSTESDRKQYTCIKELEQPVAENQELNNSDSVEKKKTKCIAQEKQNVESGTEDINDSIAKTNHETEDVNDSISNTNHGTEDVSDSISKTNRGNKYVSDSISKTNQKCATSKPSDTEPSNKETKTPPSRKATKRIKSKTVESSGTPDISHVKTEHTPSDAHQEDLPTKRQRKPKKLDLEETPVSPPKPKTPKEKKVKEAAYDDPQVPSRWMVGDLVWSKVSGHPWWPCMVSYDPYLNIYTRVHPNFRRREYHVQFFGDAAERAWIADKNTMEFQGKAKFDEYVDGLMANKGKKEKQKVMKYYGIPPARLKAVTIGIQAAEGALPLTNLERKAQYTFVYKLKKPNVSTAAAKPSDTNDTVLESGEGTKQTEKKRSRKSDLVNGVLPVKKRKLTNVDSPEPTKPAKRRKVDSSRASVGQEASFDVYCQKDRDVVLAEHPEFDEETLMEFLKQRWCMMSQKHKARYKSKYSEESELSSQMSPRKRKPSAKKLEADEDQEVEAAVMKSPSRSTPGQQRGKRKSHGKAVDKTIKQQVNTEDEATDESSKSVSKKRGRPRKSQIMEGEAAPDKQSRKSVSDADVTLTNDIKTEDENESSEPSGKKKRGRRRKSLIMEADTASDKQSDDGQESEVPVNLPPEEEEPEWEIFKLSTAGPQKKENLCQICEQTGQLLECEGPCQGYFHTDCLGLVTLNPGDSFKCDECQTGVHSCFVCKKADSTTQRCSVVVCGKFYHDVCVQKFPQSRFEGKSLICPLHHCHTCLAENLKATAKATRGRLLRCVRCPVAYHIGDFCIAAGSLSLTGFNIVCPRHFQPISTQKHHSHINVSWCFTCNRGGTLLCCESCPAAYHAECMNIETPSGSWYCPDCVRGKQPLYGEIVWVKLGSYRWWPGEICHPKNVPLNIQEKPHQVGEFPVRFLGSHDYFWLHQGRVFSFQDGDKGSRDATSKGLAKIFTKGLQEAAEAFQVWKKFKDNKEQLEQEKKKKKPDYYKYIKTNLPIGNVTIYKADPSEIPRCECKPNMESPCGPDSDCLNVLMMYECHPSTCPAEEKCQNQRFQKRLYPLQEPTKTEGRGWGLRAEQDIKKGHFVNEYVGDLVDEEECKKRIEQAHEDNIGNFYMLTIDKNRIIDAGPKGNFSRFMNHSCNPNLETQKWHVNGDVRVGLFALDDIKKGDELTFNYNLDCLGNEKTKCCCGASNCSGFLGVPPKTAAAVQNEKKSKDAKLNKLKKKKKLTVKKKHDDDCFRCGEGGELVMCDKSSCPKSYHLECLSLAKAPYGRWDCPWHHCDECGKPAVQKCVECPNSFCAIHAEGNTKTFDDKIYCQEHDELLETLADSQCAVSTTSDEVSETNSDVEAQSNKGEGDGVTVDKKSKQKKSTSKASRRESADSQASVKKGRKSAGEKKGKQGNKGKRSGKGAGNNDTQKGQVTDDPLAVAPMFDDSEDEGFGLVIDIPNF